MRGTKLKTGKDCPCIKTSTVSLRQNRATKKLLNKAYQHMVRFDIGAKWTKS